MKNFIFPIVFMVTLSLAGWITYLTNKTDQNFLEFLITLYKDRVSTYSGNLMLILILISLFAAQLFSGYAYNKFHSETNETSTKLNEKGKFQRRFRKSLRYIHDRLLILTYAGYEFSAFYILVIFIFGNSIENFDNSVQLSTNFFIAILTTLIFTLAFGVIFKIVQDLFLTRNWGKGIFSKCKIRQESIEGKLIYDLQMQICNIAFILILPLTFIGIFSEGVSETERTLFMGLTSLVTSCYIFILVKSKLFNFLFRPIN